MKTMNYLAICAGLAAAMVATATVRADDASDAHRHHHMMDGMDMSGMSMGTTPTTGEVKVRSANYDLPSVKLVREDGKTVFFADEINDGRPVVLNFVYTTCNAICPISSTVFSQLQAKLGDERVHLISISIDPDQDTPEQLRAYAQRYHAGPSWNHYTGTVEASVAVQSAFGVYSGDKMYHTPVTFVRLAPGQSWLRIDGFVTASSLLQHYRNLAAK